MRKISNQPLSSPNPEGSNNQRVAAPATNACNVRCKGERVDCQKSLPLAWPKSQPEYEVRDFVYTEYGVWHDVDDNSFGTFYFEGVEDMQVGDTIELLIPIHESK